jgi:hypothetical protein
MKTRLGKIVYVALAVCVLAAAGFGVLACSSDDDDDGGSFTITGYAGGPAAVYAVTGDPADYNEAATAIMDGSAKGIGAITSGNTVRWNVAPPAGTYTILVVKATAPATIYKITGVPAGNGGNETADWNTNNTPLTGGGITNKFDGTWTKAAPASSPYTTLKVLIKYPDYTFMRDSDYQERGIFLFTDDVVFFRGTHEKHDDGWKVDADGWTGVTYVLSNPTPPFGTGDTFTFTHYNGVHEADAYGTWTKQP